MLKVGEHIGETWAVVSTLGAGGAGSVYLCQSTESGERAAVKILRPLHPGILKRLEKRAEREAQVLSGLDHPGIVRVVDWGTDEERQAFYLGMEAVDGRELGPSDFQVGGHFSVVRAHEVFTKLVDALMYAHERELAHRDLKWQNVLLRTDGQPVLVDWGSVYVDDGERLTRFDDSGALGRTDMYAPPEAILSPSGANPFLWDIYALGVMLYIAMTGDTEPYADTADSQEMVVVKTAAALDPGEGHNNALRNLVVAATSPMPRGRPRSMKTFRKLLGAVPLPEPGHPDSEADTLFSTILDDAGAEEAVGPDPGADAGATTFPDERTPAPQPRAPVEAAPSLVASPVELPVATTSPSARPPMALLAGVGGVMFLLAVTVGGIGAWYATQGTAASTGAPDPDASVATTVGEAPVPPGPSAPEPADPPSDEPSPEPDPPAPAPAPDSVPVPAGVPDAGAAPAEPAVADVVEPEPLADPDANPTVDAESLDPLQERSPEEMARISRLITVSESTPDRMVARLAQNPQAVAQLVDDLGAPGTDPESTRIANRTYKRLLLGMQGAPADGARIARSAANTGRLDAFVVLSRQGQGGDFQLPVLQVVAKNAPDRVRTPTSVSDCRTLVEYVDLIGRDEVTAGNPWIAGACSTCSGIEGAPTGKCGRIDAP